MTEENKNKELELFCSSARAEGRGMNRPKPKPKPKPSNTDIYVHGKSQRQESCPIPQPTHSPPTRRRADLPGWCQAGARLGAREGRSLADGQGSVSLRITYRREQFRVSSC